MPRPVGAVALREWQRLDGVSPAARTALVTERVWRGAYLDSYRSAYTTVIGRIAAEATDAAVRNPRAWSTLHTLAAAAGDAITRAGTDQVVAAPADVRTITAAHAAATAPGQRPWQSIAEAAWIGGRTAGTLAGTVTAATDALIGWRARGGEALADDLRVDGRPARAWITQLLARVNRAVAAPIARPNGNAPPTAAQLARQDQVSGITVVSSPTRPSARTPAPRTSTTATPWRGRTR